MALEGAYAFDDIGSTTVVDLSGNGRDISLSGTNGSQVDGSAVLDVGALAKTGAGTISLPASLRTAIQTDDRTLMFDGVGGRAVWWVRLESASLDTGVWGALSLDAANVIVRARDQSNNGPSPASPTIGALGASRHNFAITYVRSTGVVSYYYDGALVGTSTYSPGTALYTGADDLNIAEWGDSGPALDNLRFFSHALTAGEVAALAGTPVEGGTEVTGTAVTNLGALVGVAGGSRTVTAVVTAGLGELSGTANGTRATSGAVTANLGTLNGTSVGTRTTVGNAVTSLGALLGAASGQIMTPSSAAAALGNLNAIITGVRATTGTALAALGLLRATAVVPNPLPDERIRVSGREPLRRVSGREPREAV
jgi:hypothetical protein